VSCARRPASRSPGWQLERSQFREAGRHIGRVVRIGEGRVSNRDFRHSATAERACFYREFGHENRSAAARSVSGRSYFLVVTPAQYRDPGHGSPSARLPGFRAQRTLRSPNAGEVRAERAEHSVPGFETRTTGVRLKIIPGFGARTRAEHAGKRSTEIPGNGARTYREPEHGRGGRYRETEHEKGLQAVEIASVRRDQLLVSKLTTENNNWARCCSFARKGA
jgi:hypothetical protein